MSSHDASPTYQQRGSVEMNSMINRDEATSSYPVLNDDIDLEDSYNGNDPTEGPNTQNGRGSIEMNNLMSQHIIADSDSANESHSPVHSTGVRNGRTNWDQSPQDAQHAMNSTPRNQNDMFDETRPPAGSVELYNLASPRLVGEVDDDEFNHSRHTLQTAVPRYNDEYSEEVADLPSSGDEDVMEDDAADNKTHKQYSPRVAKHAHNDDDNDSDDSEFVPDANNAWGDQTKKAVVADPAQFGWQKQRIFTFFLFNSFAMHYNWLVAGFLALVETLQLMDFVLRFDKFTINSDPVQWLQEVTSALTLRHKNIFMANWLLLSVTIIMLWTILCVQLNSNLLHSREYNRFSQIKNWCKYIVPLFGSILYIPFFSIYVELYHCTPEDSTASMKRSLWANDDCGDLVHILFSTIGTPFVIVILLLGLCSAMFQVDSSKSSVHSWSMVHTRPEVQKIIFYTVLCVVFGPMFRIKSSHEILLSATIAVFFALLAGARYYYMSFNRFIWNTVFITRDCLIMWCGIQVFVSSIINNASHWGIAVGLLWTQPFVAVATAICIYRRKWTLVCADPVKDINSCVDFHNFTKFLLEDISRHLTTESFKHNKRYTVSEYEAIIQTCEDTFLRVFRNQQYLHSPEGYFDYALFAFEFRGNYHTAHRYVLKALQMKPALDIQFQLFKLLQLIDMHYQTRSQNREIMTYIAYEHHVMLATKHDAAASKAQLNFWTLLAKPKPDIVRLNEYATSISDHNKLSLHNYRQLLSINPNSPYFLRLYASFQLDVMQDKQLAQQQIELAQYAEDTRKYLTSNGASNNNNDATALLSDKSAILVISGDDEDLGRITKSNARANNLFGWGSAEFNGKLATALFAEPYASILHKYLSSFQDRGIPLDNVSDSFMMCLHRTQFIFPAWVHIRKFVENGHMRVLLLIEHITSTKSVCSMIVSEDGYVHGMSANAGALFGVSSDKITDIATTNSSLGAKNNVPIDTYQSYRTLSADEQNYQSPYRVSSRDTLASPKGNLEEDVCVTVYGASQDIKKYQTNVHLSEFFPNFTESLWRPLRSGVSKFHYHSLIDGSVDLEDTASYLLRRDRNLMDSMPGRYKQFDSAKDLMNSSLYNTFHTFGGYFKDSADDRYLHNDAKYHDLHLTGLTVNPYFRQQPLDVPLSDRKGVRVMNRDKNPFCNYQSNRPQATVTYIPKHTAASWNLKVQMLRIASSDMPLFLLAIYPEPNMISDRRQKKKLREQSLRNLQLGSSTQLLRGDSAAVMSVQFPTHGSTSSNLMNSAVAETANETFDGGIDNYVSNSYIHGDYSFNKDNLRQQLYHESSHYGANMMQLLDDIHEDIEEEEEDARLLSSNIDKVVSPARDNLSKEHSGRLREVNDNDGEEEDQFAQEDITSGSPDTGVDLNLADDMEDDDDDSNEGIKISERLRKEVLEENEGIVKGLHKFRLIFIFSILFVLACALALYITSIIMLETYEADLSDVNFVAPQSTYYVAAAMAAQYAIIMNQHDDFIAQGKATILSPQSSIPSVDALKDGSRGGLPPFFSSYTLQQGMQLFLLTRMQNIEKAMLFINKRIQSSTANWEGTGVKPIISGSYLSRKTIDSYSVTPTAVFLMNPATGESYVSQKSVTDYLSVLLGSSRLLPGLPVQPGNLFSRRTPMVYNLISNFESLSVILHALKFNDEFVTDCNNVIKTLRIITITLYASPIFILFLVILLVLRPTVFEIEESKSQVTLVFLDIPTNIVLQLKQIYTSRIQSFQQTSIQEGGIGGSDDLEDVFNLFDIEEQDEKPKRDEKFKSTTVVPLGTRNTATDDESFIQTNDNASQYTTTTVLSSIETHAEHDKDQKQDISFSKDKYVFMIKICLLFVLSCIYFSLVFFAGIYSIEDSQINGGQLIRTNTLRIGSLGLAIHHNMIQGTYVDGIYVPPESWPQPVVTNSIWDYTKQLNADMLHGNIDIIGYYGKGYPRGDRETKIMFDSACVTLDSFLVRMEAYCPYVDDGLFSNGLVHVYDHIATKGREQSGKIEQEIREQYALNAGVPVSSLPVQMIYPQPVKVRHDFAVSLAGPQSELFKLVETFQSLLLSANEKLNDAFVDASYEMINETMSTQLALLLVFFLLSILIYVLVYTPLIHTLDVQIKRTRSMLLMIPADVLEAIPAARTMLQNKQNVL